MVQKLIAQLPMPLNKLQLSLPTKTDLQDKADKYRENNAIPMLDTEPKNPCAHQAWNLSIKDISS